MTKKWTDTPFKTIEVARQTAVNMGLKPSRIVTLPGDKKYFMVKEGRRWLLIGQVQHGNVKERYLGKREKPPPLQDPNADRFSEEDRLRTGPWLSSEHETYEDVQAYYEEQYINPDNLEFYHLLMFREGSDEYQYYKAPSGQMYVRVLSKK